MCRSRFAILLVLFALLALVASGCTPATGPARTAGKPALEQKNVQRPSRQGSPLASRAPLDPRWVAAYVQPLGLN